MPSKKSASGMRTRRRALGWSGFVTSMVQMAKEAGVAVKFDNETFPVTTT